MIYVPLIRPTTAHFIRWQVPLFFPIWVLILVNDNTVKYQTSKCMQIQKNLFDLAFFVTVLIFVRKLVADTELALSRWPHFPQHGVQHFRAMVVVP